MKNGQLKTEKSKWTFWDIYLNHGIKGSIWNMFYLNPVITFLVVLEFTSNIACTYAMSEIAKIIIASTSSNNTNNINNVNSNYFIILLIVALFTADLTRFAKLLFRDWLLFYKNQIIRRIERTVVKHLDKASPENKKKYGIDERFEALNKFIWVYDSITDTIVNITVNAVRFLTFTSYIVYKEPKLLFVLCFVYMLIWKFIIPYVSIKSDDHGGGDQYWSRAYYDILINESNNINPLFNQLYNNTDCTEQNTSNNKLKLIKPDISERYIELSQYYTVRQHVWGDTYDNIQSVQNIVTFLIVIFLFWSKLYETILIVLMNQSSMFGFLIGYSNIKKCEKNSDQSMEKITIILNAIDEQLKISNKKIKQIIDSKLKSDTRLRLDKICIKNMRICISKNENDPMDKNSYIHLNFTVLQITPQKCLLIEGCTGCGKSMTINALAGLYSGKICDDMYITNNKMIIESEFNQLLGTRCYISQLVADDYKYNGKIDLPLFKLFPGADNIDQVRSFLKDVFLLKDSCIPSSLDDSIHSKLSGGETQRYIVASQIWKVLKTNPDIVIMDEIDKALDKETAVHIMSWIMDNVGCFFIIVSHLTEVKQLLFDKKYVNQVWTYEESEESENLINIKTKNY